MKKIVLLLLVVLCGILWIRSASEEKAETESDLEKIRQVKAACEKVTYSEAIFSVGDDPGTWYVNDLELMLKEGTEANEKMIKELGADFSTKLSNGDRLFVGFLPMMQAYRIYAGDPKKANTMIYPDWEYEKVKGEW